MDNSLMVSSFLINSIKFFSCTTQRYRIFLVSWSFWPPCFRGKNIVIISCTNDHQAHFYHSFLFWGRIVGLLGLAFLKLKSIKHVWYCSTVLWCKLGANRKRFLLAIALALWAKFPFSGWLAYLWRKRLVGLSLTIQKCVENKAETSRSWKSKLTHHIGIWHIRRPQ